jgi:hypothetical protein
VSARPLAATFLVAVAAALLLTGCGATDDSVKAVADHFREAVADGDAVGACRDLAEETRTTLEQQEGKPCAEVIGKQGLPQPAGDGEVEVYGALAQVRLDGETIFLSRFDDGWRVIAAGCKPTAGDRPHDCTLEAG